MIHQHLIPQMKVGRIPINQPDELAYYASKIENNFNASFDEFNKRYLFFPVVLQLTHWNYFN
jgi:hypothetical protein